VIERENKKQIETEMASSKQTPMKNEISMDAERKQSRTSDDRSHGSTSVHLNISPSVCNEFLEVCVLSVIYLFLCFFDRNWRFWINRVISTFMTYLSVHHQWIWDHVCFDRAHCKAQKRTNKFFQLRIDHRIFWNTRKMKWKTKWTTL
jgi:hypothetical protein